eukprot:3562960-Pyramimonas_sp.AAC.1
MVVDAWNAGAGQTLGNVAYAEVWREIFRNSEDLTAPVTVEKIRSHQSWAQAFAQGCAWWAWRGNREAD